LAPSTGSPRLSRSNSPIAAEKEQGDFNIIIYTIQFLKTYSKIILNSKAFQRKDFVIIFMFIAKKSFLQGLEQKF
jgi:hypothetical protein